MADKPIADVPVDEQAEINRLIAERKAKETEGENDGTEQRTEQRTAKRTGTGTEKGTGKGTGAAKGNGAGTEKGTGKGASNSSGNDRGTANGTASNGTASKEKGSDSAGIPRDGLKKTPKQTKQAESEIDLPGNNKEIIGDVFQFVFWGIGQATGLPDDWELDDDDALVIGKNGEDWLKSLGPKKAKNVVNFLKHTGPSIAFFGSVGMALVPRVRATVKHARNNAIRPSQKRDTGTGNSSNSATPSNTPSAGIPSDDSSAGIHARSFTASDVVEVTQGHALENARG